MNLHPKGNIMRLKTLLTWKKYCKMELDELNEVINEKLSYEDYRQLPGDMSEDKAELLIEKWEKGKEKP